MRNGPSSSGGAKAVKLIVIARRTHPDHLIPGVGQNAFGAMWKNFAFAIIVSSLLFCLIPLSEFVRRSDDWLVREVETFSFTPPPPPKTQMEKQVEKEALTEPILPKLIDEPQDLDIDLLTATLDVGPGDFKALSLANYNLASMDSGTNWSLPFTILTARQTLQERQPITAKTREERFGRRSQTVRLD